MDFNSSALWGIVGFIISYFFYRIGLKRRQVSIDIDTYPIISQKVSQVKGLEVKYNSKEIDTLYFSTITIKNVGNMIIEKTDFAPAHPLAISTNGIFLGVKDNGIQLVTQNEANSVCPLIKLDDKNECKEITIEYDYLSKREELICTLFHTGVVSYSGVLKDGKIIDGEEIKKHEKIKKLIMDVIVFFMTIIIAMLFSIKPAY